MKRNLLLAGGIYHPFEESSAALARILAAEGYATEIRFDIEEALADLAQQPADLVTVNALRWTMLQHEKYVPFRAQWALSLSQSGRAAISAHAARGGALFGLHTASICFDDWPEWRDLLGVAWRWGRSYHPSLQKIDVAIDAGAEATGGLQGFGLQGFEVQDELYCNLDRAPGTFVLAHGTCADMAEPQPVAFAHEHRERRAAYIALGHDAASFETPSETALIAACVRWLSLGGTHPAREVCA